MSEKEKLYFVWEHKSTVKKGEPAFTAALYRGLPQTGMNHHVKKAFAFKVELPPHEEGFTLSELVSIYPMPIEE